MVRSPSSSDDGDRLIFAMTIALQKEWVPMLEPRKNLVVGVEATSDGQSGTSCSCLQVEFEQGSL